MRSSLRVATVFGININLHVTFVLVLLLGAWPWLMWGPAGALFGAVMSLAVFGCIALHELGHSLVAKAYGIPVTDITLTPIGGVAVLKFHLDGVTLGEGATNIVGRGLIVHISPDDYKTQPTGNSGARIACAVIQKL